MAPLKRQDIHAIVFSLWLLLTLTVVNANTSNNKCKPRHYTHKAIQTDMNGKRCFGEVKILSCWGYCLSYEVTSCSGNSTLI